MAVKPIGKRGREHSAFHEVAVFEEVGNGMSGIEETMKLSNKEVAAAFSDSKWAELYPPVLDIDQAADLAGVSKETIYDWRSRGLLNGCSRRFGKRVRIFRDKFVQHLFNTGA